MPKALVNGVHIYYEISGSGPLVLQVAGAVVGHEGYASVTPGMARHFTVIDFDHRGYGLSDRPDQKYTFDVWADDMAGLLDSLDIERTHVHGGSMGSSLAIHYAAKYPDRVNCLVLSGCTARSDFMAKLQFGVWKALARAYGTGSVELASILCAESFAREFLDGPHGGWQVVETLAATAARNVEVDVFCDACDALIDIDVVDSLRQIVAPTLVMVGDEDILTPANQGPSGAGGRFIYDHLTNARIREYVVISNSGHANLMDSPEVSNQAVVSFLQKVEASRGDLQG